MSDGQTPAPRRSRRRMLVLAVVVGLIIMIRLFFFELHVIEGVSMWPSFNRDGGTEWVIVRKSSTPPGPGALVVLRDPDGNSVLKRQIASETDSVTLVGGDALVNGAVYPRSLDEVLSTRVPVLRLDQLRWGQRGGERALIGPLDEAVLSAEIGRCSLSEGGRHLLIDGPDSRGAAVYPVRGEDILDDHRSSTGRMVRGRHRVRDVIVTFAVRRWTPGLTFSLEQFLETGDHPRSQMWISATSERFKVTVAGASNPATGAPMGGETVSFPFREGLEFRLTLVDGLRVLETRDPALDASFKVRIQQPRRVLSEYPRSYLRLGVKGGSVVLSRLDIDRDIHYTPPSAGDGSTASSTPIIVPRGAIFALGDNSAESRDSRYWALGKTEVVGRPTLVIWPPERMRWIGR